MQVDMVLIMIIKSVKTIILINLTLQEDQTQARKRAIRQTSLGGSWFWCIILDRPKQQEEPIKTDANIAMPYVSQQKKRRYVARKEK